MREVIQKQIFGETLELKWEYAEISFKPATCIDRFNEMGRKGWELAYCSWDQKYAVFKRPI